LRTGWRKWAVVAGGAFVLLYVLYKLVVIFVLTDVNQPASEQIVTAVEKYKLANKRYPEKLAQLQPKYLPKIPQPAPGTTFLHDVGRSDAGLRRIASRFSRCAPLSQEIPALIELHLDLLQPCRILVGKMSLPEEAVFLAHEALDICQGALVASGFVHDLPHA